MGCDIHGFVEVTISSGISSVWIATLNLDYLMRDYGLFADLFGVRASVAATPIAANRGLPHNRTDLTHKSYVEMGIDAHSASWATWDEIKPVMDKYRNSLIWPKRDYYGEWEAAYQFCEAMIENGQGDKRLPEHVRWVAWFDN